MQTLYYDAPSNTSRRSSSARSTTYNYDCGITYRRSSSARSTTVTTTVELFIVVVVVTIVLLVTTTVGCFIVRRRRRRMMMEAKSCANISQNLLYCSPSYTSTYIGTPKFLTKALWVYSHLKSDFFSEKN